MWTQFLAGLLSFLSFFQFWNGAVQPNNIPETRRSPYGAGTVPDKYGIWPTTEFTTGKAPWWLNTGITEAAFSLKGMRNHGMTTESLLILYKGKLVYERYAEGWDKDKPHYMASATKSITSALVGIAIDEGKIGGVDDKVIQYFPEAVITDESKRDMTIEHLLTMTNGLMAETQEQFMTIYGKDVKDSALAAFLLPQSHAPGTKYEYTGFGPIVLLGIVARATGRDVMEYAQEKLFGPLGMQSVIWEKFADGLPWGDDALSMTPRDMLRFGYLYLNYGRWEDKQIIPADWVAQSGPRGKAPWAYGRLFWNYPLEPFNSSFEANGANGQYICILPEKDMVIARTGTFSAFDLWTEKMGF